MPPCTQFRGHQAPPFALHHVRAVFGPEIDQRPAVEIECHPLSARLHMDHHCDVNTRIDQHDQTSS